MDRVEHPVLLVGSVMTKDMTAARMTHRSLHPCRELRTTEFCKLHECLAPWQQAPAALEARFHIRLRISYRE